MARAKRSKEPLPEKAIVLMVGEQLHKQASDLYTARFHVEVAMAAAKKANARKRLRNTLKIVLRGLEVGVSMLIGLGVRRGSGAATRAAAGGRAPRGR